MGKIKILQDKKPGKTGSFFYDGAIAELEGKDGTVYQLIAAGEIRIIVDGDVYRDPFKAEYEQKLDDRKLRELEASGKLVWDMNNWFEVIWKEGKSSNWECDLGVVEFDYDSGIQLLRDYAENHEVKA